MSDYESDSEYGGAGENFAAWYDPDLSEDSDYDEVDYEHFPIGFFPPRVKISRCCMRRGELDKVAAYFSHQRRLPRSYDEVRSVLRLERKLKEACPRVQYREEVLPNGQRGEFYEMWFEGAVEATNWRRETLYQHPAPVPPKKVSVGHYEYYFEIYKALGRHPRDDDEAWLWLSHAYGLYMQAYRVLPSLSNEETGARRNAIRQDLLGISPRNDLEAMRRAAAGGGAETVAPMGPETLETVEARLIAEVRRLKGLHDDAHGGGFLREDRVKYRDDLVAKFRELFELVMDKPVADVFARPQLATQVVKRGSFAGKKFKELFEDAGGAIPMAWHAFKRRWKELF